MSTKIKNIPSIIGLKDLRLNADKYINAIARGKSFTVVRRSKPIFNISPIPVDEWGDEGTWKSLVNFNKFKKGGVRAEEVLASLKRLEEYE
jgi:antitoxin (DNA-binding transcriptional repressor) of toxin-antitoxin stability system